MIRRFLRKNPNSGNGRHIPVRQPREIDAKRGSLGVQCRPLGSPKSKFRSKTVGGCPTDRHELPGKDGGPIKALTLEMLVNASFGVVEERRAA